MLQEIQAQALRLDRSVSWVVRKAWEIAAAELSTRDNDWISELMAAHAVDDLRKQTVYLPPELVAELRRESARLVASLSHVVLGAYVHARDAIAAISHND